MCLHFIFDTVKFTNRAAPLDASHGLTAGEDADGHVALDSHQLHIQDPFTGSRFKRCHMEMPAVDGRLR